MKPSNTKAIARVTFEQLSDYLDSGAPLTQVLGIISMLQDYATGVENKICDWREYIPAVNIIGSDRAIGWKPQVNLQIILTFLFQQGYQVRFPRLDADGVSATWEVLKNGRISKLEYKPGIGYSLNGVLFKLNALK